MRAYVAANVYAYLLSIGGSFHFLGCSIGLRRGLLFRVFHDWFGELPMPTVTYVGIFQRGVEGARKVECSGYFPAAVVVIHPFDTYMVALRVLPVPIRVSALPT